ncbi:MAG: CADD family putative folate metabolism protein [Elusimicrobia bacterium]|nr:CADD family putative folate metabolism protein [Elusimicrobiota bacterium]
MGWWRDVEAIIEENSLLKHPFYQAWQKGMLSIEDLRYYARQYYPHVAHFPRYVSATHSNTADADVRRMLLENLIEEERGEANHPELWLRFAEGLGEDRKAVLAADVQPETARCVDTFMSLSKDADALKGLSALYAYESQIPAVSRTKMQGLGEFYGIKDDRTQSFFKVHEAADVWHSQTEREAIERLADTPEKRETVKRSVEASCKAVWELLDGVVEARKIACPV